MILKIFFLFFIAIIFSCSNSNVAITQTGNPPKISLGVSIYRDTTSTARHLRDDKGDSITSIKITSAILIVKKITLFGNIDSLEFSKDDPYVINIALDSSINNIDTVGAEDGMSFDSITMSIAKLSNTTNSTLYDSLKDMQNKSIRITGFLNGNTSDTFNFSTDITTQKVIPLQTSLTIDKNVKKKILMVFDIKKWFINSEGGFLNPKNLGDENDIEDSFLGSISGDNEIEDESEEIE